MLNYHCNMKEGRLLNPSLVASRPVLNCGEREGGRAWAIGIRPVNDGTDKPHHRFIVIPPSADQRLTDAHMVSAMGKVVRMLSPFRLAFTLN